MDKSLLDRLGAECYDRISGMAGELRGVAFYSTGRCSCAIAPVETARDGTIHELQWIDADRLKFAGE